MGKAINEIGNVYERLTVTAEAGADRFGKKLFRCRCICGNELIVYGSHLHSGNTKSCGCLNREKTVERNKNNAKYTCVLNSDGEEIRLTKTRLYKCWGHMIDRCTNPKCNVYKHYGGKGVSICEPWLNDFMAFAHWAYSNGYYEQPKNTPHKDVLSIDRIDTNGNYEPSNCRWITVSENVAKRNVENAKKNED